jgi:hypothetical protein
MSERVDKNWQSRGIEAFSTEQILGTLAHYGAVTDEAGFRERAKADFPLAIAQEWHQGWKGKGQFAHFPAAASEELWHRFMAPDVAPTDVVLACVNLLKTLDEVLGGKADDGTWNTRFAVVEAYLPKFPEPGVRREKFVGEFIAAMGEWMEVFDSMSQALAKKQQDAFADRLVVIEGTIFPERALSAKALVLAARGQLDAAVKDLAAISDDATKPPYERLSAIDALLSLEKGEAAKPGLLALLDEAQAKKDLELASHAVEQLTELLQANPKLPDRQALRARVEALAASFGGGGEE